MTEKTETFDIIVPDWVAQLPPPPEDMSAGGFLEDDSDILSPPRIKITQGLTTEVTEGLVPVGHYWSTAEGIALGPWVEGYVLKWAKEGIKVTDECKLEWRTTDPHDPRVLEGDNSWKCRAMNCLFFVTGAENWEEGQKPYPAMYTFHSTGMSEGRELYKNTRRLATKKNHRLCLQRYRLGIFLKPTGEKNKHHASTFQFKGYPSDVSETADLITLSEGFAKKEVVVEYDGGGQEDDTDFFS